MARVAADDGTSFEILLVEIENELDHFAPGLLLRLGVAGEVETLGLLVEDVAEIAADAERSGHVVHGEADLGVGEVGQQLHVFLLGINRDRGQHCNGKNQFAHGFSFRLRGGG